MRKIGEILLLTGFLFLSACSASHSNGGVGAGIVGGGASCSIDGGTFGGVTSADLVMGTSARLHWNADSGAHSYVILNATGSTPSVVATVAAPATQYTVMGLNPSTTYRFQVRALSSQGQTDLNSAQVSFTTTTTEAPASLGGLVLWLRADDLNGNGDSNAGWSDGDTVATWVDKGGGSYDGTQGVASQRPVLKTGILNGGPVVRFDGTNDYLSGNVGALAAPLSVFVVGYFDQGNQASGDYDYLFNMGTASGAGSNMSFSRTAGNYGSGGDRYYCYDGSGVSLGPALTGQSWGIFAAVHGNSAPRHQLFLNGSSLSVSDYGTSLSLDGTYDLGRYRAGNSHFLKGDLAEVIVYSGALSPADRQSIECYLSNRYSIAIGHGC